ncbi:MAG TPA: hypothetical protein VM008_11970 [Phycisphaerae bacterium]|nr:hypothetical protein [Phycisphaerae bacterium]
MRALRRLLCVVLPLFLISLTANSASAMLNPTLGRFMQEDTAGYRDSKNWFQYEKSHPEEALDYSGLYTIAPGAPPYRIVLCQAIYASYKAASHASRACNQGMSCPELLKNILAASAEAGLRGGYMAAGCDSVFLPDPGEDPADHPGQYNQVLNRLTTCGEMYIKKCGKCDKQPVQLPVRKLTPDPEPEHHPWWYPFIYPGVYPIPITPGGGGGGGGLGIGGGLGAGGGGGRIGDSPVMIPYFKKDEP